MRLKMTGLVPVLLLCIFLIFGCSSGDESNDTGQEMLTQSMEEDNTNTSSPENSQQANTVGDDATDFSQAEKEFATEYPQTMEQCMFIEQGEVDLTEDGMVRAKIFVKQEIEEDFLAYRMEQHITKLAEQYNNRKVMLEAVYVDSDTIVAEAAAAQGEVETIEIKL